jgi:riboflavin biosynthesis pyrimidine reductase
MVTRSEQAVEPLTTLFDEASGEALPLPPELLELYGPLRLRSRPERAHVFANFVASLDGIVSVDPPRGNGGQISGNNAQDLAIMGLLRAVADGVVIGAGNLRADGSHVWTADRICPELAGPYARLRAGLGKTAPPLQIVVSGSGRLDLSQAVFSSVAPSVVVTTEAGRDRLRDQRPGTRVVVAGAGDGWIPLAAVLDAADMRAGAFVLVESGPTSTTRYLAERAVDELFLTRAPILVGRAAEPPTLALAEKMFFPPGSMKGRLLSARRGGDSLFLRYGFGAT